MSNERKTAYTKKAYTKKAYVKKAYVKKYKVSNNLTKGTALQFGSSLVMNSMPIFPARSMKRMRYSTSFGLSAAAGTVQTYVFSANGLFDPDITGTGHQPMGFDQMMLFYNHYCVTWAKLTLVAYSQSTTAPGQVLLRQDAAAIPITNIDRLLEMGGSVYTHIDISGSANAQKELSLIVNTPKLQGITIDNCIADATLRGDVGANPTEQSYFHVQLFNSFGVTTTCNFDVIVDYISYFMEPRTQQQS